MNNDHPSNNSVNSGADGGPWQQGLLFILASSVGCFLYNRKSQEAKKLRRETEELKQEKERLSKALLTVQNEEEKFQHSAEVLLEEVEQKLMKRQAIYCSYVTHRDERLVIERNLVDMVRRNPVGTELKMEDDLINIFQRDTYCADLCNTDEKRNGSLMWNYLSSWKAQVKRKKENMEMLKDTLASHNN